MGKSLIKDILREIKKSLGRFIAIFAIVAIGVAFFAGVTASSGDMRNSADSYFDKYNFMDVHLISTVGFNQEDVNSIVKIQGVIGVHPIHSMDALVQLDSTKAAVKLMSLPIGEYNSDNQDYINQLRIKEGRLPEKTGECVVKYEAVQGDTIQIGDKINLESGTDSVILDSMKTEQYEVVGIIYTPYYLSYEMGSTSIGNGKISHAIFIPDSDFISEYYTDIFATIDDVKQLNSYEDVYFDKVKPVTDKLEELGKIRINQRIEDIKKEINDQVTSKLRLMLPPNTPETIINEEVQNAQNKALENSSDWKWFVLDRNSHYSYRDYGQCADRMDSIASVFPIFFFFVSALVCLTTMTRMVDEQRGMIGTMKALGYSKTSIALKYISYAFVASLLGGITGCIIGLNVFPRVIYSSWNIMYQLPPIEFASHTGLIILSIGSMTIITTLAAFFACYKELIEQPSMLMRPKVPQKGKKILLERVGFLWKRMKFTQKVTARNIFRYKKRFVMTLIGIAGCTALLLAGFGIKDSIAGLVTNQFKQIFKYNSTISLDKDLSEIQRNQILNKVELDTRITDSISVYSSIKDVNSQADEDSNHEDISVNLVAVDNSFNNLKDFILFRSRSTHKTYELNNQGVIISEKLAKDLNVKVGDGIYIEDSQGIKKKLVISNITEMYVNHYVFISDEYYSMIFGEIPIKNEILCKLSSSDIEAENLIGNDYLDVEGIESVTFFSMSIEKFDDMIQSLDLVTYVLIISAALLAFVVLYNLTNVNISERLREIATIKVLGFYDNEVAVYVYRENIVITIIGALLGLLLGVILHGFIMKTVEMDAVMYGYEVHISSFFTAFLLTLLFSLIVNIVMYRKLQNIQMVESLKSVE